MNILCYRGHLTPGGVSTTLSRVIDIGNSVIDFSHVPIHLIEGHHRYCNNIRWPIFHQPQYATFGKEHHAADRRFALAARRAISGKR